jgi:hypothetical protein
VDSEVNFGHCQKKSEGEISLRSSLGMKGRNSSEEERIEGGMEGLDDRRGFNFEQREGERKEFGGWREKGIRRVVVRCWVNGFGF